MRFAKNRLYVEKYVKCPNCGILIFEPGQPQAKQPTAGRERPYCSDWCVAWEAERRSRLAAEDLP